MTPTSVSLIVAVLVSGLVAPVAHAAAPIPDSVYRLAADGGDDGRVIPGTSGEPVAVGDRLALEVRGSDLRALDNANTRFHLSLDVPYDHQLTKRLDHVLVLGGVAYPQTGASSVPSTVFIQFQIVGREQADRAAALFETKPVLRRHPGHRLLVTFEPDAESVGPGADLPVKMTITNVGDLPVTFMDGGHDSSTRNNQFSFTAAIGNEAATPVDPGWEHGGLAAFRTLEPGRSHEWDVRLRKYLTLEAAGWYDALGTFALEIVDPEDVKSGRVVWQDYISARFLFRVEPPS